MKFFTDDIVAMFSSMSASIDAKSFVFVTDSAYSAFQFARVYKFNSIHFEDMFDAKIFAYAKKSKIKCSFSDKLVTESNKEMFSVFAKSNYNPIDKHSGSLSVFSKHQSVKQVVDISAYKKGDEYVFLSNMKGLTHVELVNAKIVGFSYDTSVFSGSKKIHKQVRIANIKHAAKVGLPTYGNDDIQKVMSGQAKMHFGHLKFLFKMMDDFAKMPMFSSMMSDLSTASQAIKKSVFSIDSMSKKEIFNPKLFEGNEVRVRRVAKGSGVDERVIGQIISFILMVNKHGIQGLVDELQKKGGKDSQVSKMLGQLGPLMKMFGKK
jgi:hypothetical protein